MKPAPSGGSPPGEPVSAATALGFGCIICEALGSALPEPLTGPAPPDRLTGPGERSAASVAATPAVRPPSRVSGGMPYRPIDAPTASAGPAAGQDARCESQADDDQLHEHEKHHRIRAHGCTTVRYARWSIKTRSSSAAR